MTDVADIVNRGVYGTVTRAMDNYDNEDDMYNALARQWRQWIIPDESVYAPDWCKDQIGRRLYPRVTKRIRDGS